MPEITLAIENLETLRTVDPKLMSYNVEMTEVTGGTFWKAYTPGQIALGFHLSGCAAHPERSR